MSSATLLAAQLVFGLDEIWLPERRRRVTLASEGRFVRALIGVIRRLERVSRPRATFVFGLLVAAGSSVAFLAPPFTGLDTLPALGVVLVAVGVLLQDLLVVLAGVAVAAVGAVLVLVVGAAAIHGIDSLICAEVKCASRRRIRRLAAPGARPRA